MTTEFPFSALEIFLFAIRRIVLSSFADRLFLLLVRFLLYSVANSGDSILDAFLSSNLRLKVDSSSFLIGDQLS